MNTKNNIKDKLDSFLQKLGFKNNSLTEKNKNLFMHNHRIFIRNKFLLEPLTLATFLSILPFVIGFSQFLSQKYSSQKTNFFFEQNLPGLNFPTQKIHWDTFQYLIQDQTTKDLLDGVNLNKLSWSEKDIRITAPINTILTKKELIGYIQTSNDLPSIKSKWYKLFLNQKDLNFTNSFYQNLDEIPEKLQSNFEISQFNKPLSVSSTLKCNLEFSEIHSSSLQNQVFANKLFSKNFLIGYHLKPLTTEKEFKIDSLKQSILKKNSYKKQNEFFSKRDLLKKEVRKIFNNTNIAPTFSIKSKSYKNLENLLKTDDIKLAQEIIFEIDQIKLPQSINLNRLMSGYNYPDMNLNEVICFIFQKRSSKNLILKILLPSNYLFPQFSQLKNSTFPSYLIQLKNLTLTDKSQREVFYEGPALTLNPETGLDWELLQKNSLSFRLWLENYLGSKNPTRQSLKNFFGNFDYLDFLKEIQKQDYYFEQFSIFQNNVISNIAVKDIPFNPSFQLPEISNSDWENYLNKNLRSNDLNSAQYNTVLLPIFEVRTPKSENPDLFFSYKNSLDFEFIHPFSTLFSNSTLSDRKLVTGKLNQINFRLSFSNFNDDNSFPTYLTSGQYQKIPSIFQINSKVFFSDIWEPLTFRSWLITAQIGFAFLVFKILKALADNYGRELLVYLLDLVALLGFLDDDLKQEIEILMGQREKGFRIISKITKNFNNIGGIQTLLPEIIEIVWFLRNSGREFSLSKTLPRGVLLTGPPGTGKTLLVQAIAGEAEVPVLALSGSSLLEPGESGALKLEILFQEARKLAPCIVFIDEMDTLAEKREQVLQNPMGADEILESLSHIQPTTLSSPLAINLGNENSEKLTDAIFAQQDMHKEKLRILMQFLVELDGIQGRDGVVVIGATNRPEMLDPAILRPGRFDRLLELGLPGPEKRREILKLYSENLGIDKNISWNYLIHRTAGYSAADLAGIMNQSTLNAILKNSHHTIESIEYGIDRITTIGIEKPTKIENYTGLTLQVAYYQAGKILLSALLEYHPPILVTHLWPRRTNVRALQINENLQKYFFRFARRIELEHRIIGCYAGKAAEILFLQQNFHSANLSDLGVEDVQFAQNLIKYMIKNWYFYGKGVSIQENANILTLFNEKEYRNSEDKIPFFNSILETNELSLFNKGEQFGANSYKSSNLSENSIEQNSQKYFPTASWQYQISNEFELSTRAFSDWYRLYLPDPQQTERNLEWTPPDEFYHGNDFPEKLTQSITWNQLGEINIDYEIHSLILQSFNKAITLLDTNREILDRLAYELLTFEILREPDVQKIFNEFNILLNSENTILPKKSEVSEKSLNKDFIPIYKDWGTSSRRKLTKWLDLKSIKNSKE